MPKCGSQARRGPFTGLTLCSDCQATGVRLSSAARSHPARFAAASYVLRQKSRRACSGSSAARMSS